MTQPMTFQLCFKKNRWIPLHLIVAVPFDEIWQKAFLLELAFYFRVGENTEYNGIEEDALLVYCSPKDRSIFSLNYDS